MALKLAIANPDVRYLSQLIQASKLNEEIEFQNLRSGLYTSKQLRREAFCAAIAVAAENPELLSEVLTEAEQSDDRLIRGLTPWLEDPRSAKHAAALLRTSEGAGVLRLGPEKYFLSRDQAVSDAQREFKDSSAAKTELDFLVAEDIAIVAADRHAEVAALNLVDETAGHWSGDSFGGLVVVHPPAVEGKTSNRENSFVLIHEANHARNALNLAKARISKQNNVGSCEDSEVWRTAYLGDNLEKLSSVNYQSRFEAEGQVAGQLARLEQEYNDESAGADGHSLTAEWYPAPYMSDPWKEAYDQELGKSVQNHPHALSAEIQEAVRDALVDRVALELKLGGGDLIGRRDAANYLVDYLWNEKVDPRLEAIFAQHRQPYTSHRTRFAAVSGISSRNENNVFEIAQKKYQTRLVERGPDWEWEPDLSQLGTPSVKID